MNGQKERSADVGVVGFEERSELYNWHSSELLHPSIKH